MYASWNGATQVAPGASRGGCSPGALQGSDGTAPRTGFETTLILASAPAYLAVQALNAHGKVIGTSSVRAVAPLRDREPWLDRRVPVAVCGGLAGSPVPSRPPRST